MTQESTNQTFFRQTNQVERANPVDANSVEFLSGQPPSMNTNPKRIWIDQVTEALKWTIDGVDIHTVTSNGMLFINVKEPPYNAVGDGIADDTDAFNAAIAQAGQSVGGGVILAPRGRYRTTSELVIDITGVWIEGQGNTWTGSDSTVIFYDGAVDANAAVLRVSTTSIGVEPVNSVSTCKLRNIVLDGNSKAGYGLYSAYATNETLYDGVTAINTTQHGIFLDKMWYASCDNLLARNNLGCGITIGKNPTWGGVNGVYLGQLRAANNGLDNTFNETTGKENGYGIGIYKGASLVIKDVVTESNVGAGLVMSNIGEVSGIEQFYAEANCPSGTEAWAIIYIGNTNGRGHFLRNIFLFGDTGDPRPQTIWLTGTRPNNVLTISNVYYGKLKADWDNYTLSTAYEGITNALIGHLPRSPINGAPSLTTIFVRAGGSDLNDGRTAGTAYATLEKALETANFGNNVTTIDCTGVSLTTPTLNFAAVLKPLTINGGGTAVLANSVTGTGFTINNASRLVTVQNFAQITRLFINNCANVRITGVTFSFSDSSNLQALIESTNATVHLGTSTLDPGVSAATNKNGIQLFNTTIRMETVTFNVLTAGRYIRFNDGSQANADSYYAAFDQVQWVDNTGFIIAGNKVKTVAGSVTLV